MCFLSLQTTDPLDDTEAQVEEITLPLSANEEFMACSNEKVSWRYTWKHDVC